MPPPRSPIRTAPPIRTAAPHGTVDPHRTAPVPRAEPFPGPPLNLLRRPPVRRSARRSARRPPAGWRVRLWRLRYVATALCLAAATAAVAARLEAPPAPTRPLVVAGRALVAGDVVTADAVRVVQVPTEAVPDGAHGDPADVVGRSLAIGLPAGLAVVDPLLAGGAPAGPAGTVVIPVRFADSIAGGLLHAGDRVDVLASAGSLAGTSGVGERLARRALVLSMETTGTTLAGKSSSTAEGLLGSSGDGAGAASVVLLAVSPDEAAALAGAASWASLSPVFVQ